MIAHQKGGPSISKISPHLWFPEKAGEAAAFYASVFPDSHVDYVDTLPIESPSGPAGSVEIIEMTLCGQTFLAIAAGPLDPFNHAISFYVLCEDQAEVDHYWAKLGEGGTPEQCGWMKDKYGVLWQIVPRAYHAMMKDPDRTRVKRAMTAMMGMVKLDLAALQKAFDGA